MAAFDLDEQEQIDALKQFWKAYGKLIMVVALSVVVGFGGTKWWQHRQVAQAQIASEKFNQLETAEQDDDSDVVKDFAEELVKNHNGTYYADLARLKLAKTLADSSDLEEAITVLNEIIGESKDEILVSLAKLRLSTIFLQLEDFDSALRVLDGDGSSSMSGLYADSRGDIYAAQGSFDMARSFYTEALTSLPEGNPWRDIVQIKIDSIGTK